MPCSVSMVYFCRQLPFATEIQTAAKSQRLPIILSIHLRTKIGSRSDENEQLLRIIHAGRWGDVDHSERAHLSPSEVLNATALTGWCGGLGFRVVRDEQECRSRKLLSVRNPLTGKFSLYV
jgi:hypothetical protein